MKYSKFRKPSKIAEGVMVITRKLWPVKWYVSILYRLKFGRTEGGISCAQTFTQKLNRSKVYDRNPEYWKYVDKYEVKSFVAKTIGEEYVVPCYGVWDDFDNIDFDKLPDKFILKCTHDSSGIAICRGKKNFDFENARKKIVKSQNTDYYWYGREWPYKNATRRIIADELLDDGREGELQDYKWWCFNGEPKIMYITNKGKAGKILENFYDMDFNPIDVKRCYPRRTPEYTKPAEFELMKELASKLSKNFKFIRVDFFDIHGKVYFGELTFFDHAGFLPFEDEEWDKKIGTWF